MTDFPFPFPHKNDPRVVQMIRDWWALHPENDPDHLDDDWEQIGTHTYRHTLHASINAASDGELETLVPQDSLHWIFLVGIAAAPIEV